MGVNGEARTHDDLFEAPGAKQTRRSGTDAADVIEPATLRNGTLGGPVSSLGSRHGGGLQEVVPTS